MESTFWQHVRVDSYTETKRPKLERIKTGFICSRVAITIYFNTTIMLVLQWLFLLELPFRKTKKIYSNSVSIGTPHSDKVVHVDANM